MYRDLTGQRFGRLVAVTPIGRNANRAVIWQCRCDCGADISTSSSELTRRSRLGTQSCGCANNVTHGMTGSRTYNSWKAVVARCTNPRAPGFTQYGARGITMCARWRESFDAFLEDMGERPHGTSIDRIDNNRGYEPGNCRWATPRQQSRNTRTVVITESSELEIRRLHSEGLSGRAIGERLGITPSSVSRVICGRYSVLGPTSNSDKAEESA